MSQIEQMPFLNHKKSSLIRNEPHSNIICPLIHLRFYHWILHFPLDLATLWSRKLHHDQYMALFDNDVANKNNT
jgi:hypothetical protein